MKLSVVKIVVDGADVVDDERNAIVVLYRVTTMVEVDSDDIGLLLGTVDNVIFLVVKIVVDGADGADDERNAIVVLY